MKEQFFTEVENGVLAPSAIAKLTQASRLFSGHIKVTVEKKRRIRSLSQNAYYHGCIIPFYQQGIREQWDEEIGHDQAHEMLKNECNWKEKVKEETGEVKRFTLSTKDLSTIDFEQYMERCRRFIKEYFGMSVPLPNEQAAIDFAA